MKPIATVTRTREIQQRYNIQTKKKYGQNFIVEPSVVQRIAQAAVAGPDELVFEIGPGIGALTECLCQQADHVVAIEIDERMKEVLQNEVQGNLDIVMQDVLEADLESLISNFRQEHQKVVFAGNLPYYITTPILFKLFESDADIERITVMMQKEVAQRFLAKDNDAQYNALSVITQYRCHTRKVMDVGRGCFWPVPRVDSTVLQFTFHDEFKVDDEALFFDLVKACFKQRRKTIYNNLSEWTGSREKAMTLLEKAGIEPETRAQQCTIDDFIRLYEADL